MKKTKIKICGNTNGEDVDRLLDYKIDALGFIVTERDITSRVDLDLAAKLIKEVPKNILSVVGVGHYSADEIIEICRKTKADVVQLQRGGSLEDIAKIRKTLPKIEIWKTIFTSKELEIGEVLEYERASDAILLHSKESEWESGVEIARKLRKPFVLAGGLYADNVRKAIDLFNPWMVDLISGVETVLGKKDLKKVDEFVKIVKG